MVMEAFSRAAAKPEGTNDFLEAILRERPDLRDQPHHFATNGLHSNTVIFEQEVFKGPRYKNDVSSFDDEYGILQQMKGKGLPVPEVTYVGKETVFYGMTRVAGDDLPDVIGKLTAEEKQLLAQDIADFIIRLAGAMPAGGGNFAKHADIMKNVLVDPETKRLSAVIDFESLRYAPKDHLTPNVVDEFTDMVKQEFDHKKSEIQGSMIKRAILKHLHFKKS